MPPTTLTALIEAQTEALTSEALETVITNPRTPSFRSVPRGELAERLGSIYRGLGAWLARHDDDVVRAAFEDWGRTRFTQKIPISEVVYCVLLGKERLRRHARDGALADLHEVEASIGDFFDRALYYLVRGYEMQAATPSR